MALFNDAQQRPFLEAARRGDLPAVQRYFELPDVRENVALWNAVHRAERLGEPSPVPSPNRLPRPWYIGTRRDERVFGSAIVDAGQVELFQWFYAREQLGLFGESLRSITNDTLRSCIFHKDYTAAREMVDIVMQSALFTEALNDIERLTLLGVMLNTAASRGYHWWVGALLAYGADPNYFVEHETPLTAIAYQGNSKTLDLLLAHGAWMEGKDLLAQRAYDRSEALFGELLRRGADANVSIGDVGSPLHQAASYCFGTTVEMLIHKGFAYVDARDRRGRTPAVMVVRESRHHRRGNASREEILELLLEGGALVHAVDEEERGLLYHALRSRSGGCLIVCLEFGADPNLRDINGRTPMALILKETGHEVYGSLAQILKILLQAGADPFVLDDSGECVAMMLASTETGRAFLQENEAFFRRS